MSTAPIPTVEKIALLHLTDLLEKSGAEFATEQQWRAHADRGELVPNHVVEPVIGTDGKQMIGADGKPKVQPVDQRARGFRIPDMIERGLLTTSNAAFHAARGGQVQPAIPLYRPA